MIIDTANYPRINLPFGLRIQLLWNALMQFAMGSSAEEGELTPIGLERRFREVINRENATISKICFSYSDSVAEFEDLRQDALINIWRGIRNFRGDCQLKTWVYRVTVNSCLSTIRRESRHRHESLEGLYGLIDGNETDRTAIEQMHQVISRLGAQERAIIMMWLDELSYDEIANAMGMNRNTVATKIRRIKEKITKEYSKEGEL